MRNLKLFIAIFVFTVSSAAALYGQEAKQEAAPAAAAPKTADEKQGGHVHADKEKRYVASVDPDGVQRVEITGGEYYFEPNYIVVKVNIPVELKVKKTGFVPHDIVVKAPEAGIVIDESLDRKARTIRFTPTATGKFEMSCSKKLPFAKSHKEKGMDGMIEVVQ